jgi:putative transposase
LLRGVDVIAPNQVWSTDITYIRLLHGFGQLPGVLIQQGITISMDGRGRALDNIFVERLWRTVKYEDVYLKGYETMPTLLLGLTDYFLFYNGERQHQSLGYTTTDMVYHTATGGGAKIVDRFNSMRGSSVPAEELGQHQLAAV